MGKSAQKPHEAITVTPAVTVYLVPAPVSDATDDGEACAEPGCSNQPADNADYCNDHTHHPAAAPTSNDTTPPTHHRPARSVEPVKAGEIITPVPTDVTAGDMAGHPLIVGGDDLDDSSLTLVAYQDTHGGDPREVLYGWVNPEAEHKILDALALDEEKLVAVQVTKNIDGRIPLDHEHDLYEQVQKVAKSVNHHLKNGDGIPQHTHDNLATLVTTVDSLTAGATDDEAAMLATYKDAAARIAITMSDGYDKAYASGGKIPFIDPYTVNQTVTVTEMVPAPAPDTPPGLLPAAIRDATRIKPTLDENGVGAWDGTSRYTSQGGKEYRVDLGDGYEAVYRPALTTSTSDQAKVGQRGFLEVVAPQGTGHGPELVDRLAQLNLVNRPMTRAEAEWTYLQRNVWAQRLDQHPAIAKATATAQGLDDTFTELVFAERVHHAIGMSDTELARFAKQIRLEAEAQALPAKTRLVRDAVATHLGYPSGADLAASVGYDPTPRRSAGWYTWDRFDVAADPAATSKRFGSRVLFHRVTGGNPADIIRNSGALAATERRRVMGITPGLGMSESADMTSGGSRVVDLRIGDTSPNGPCFIWNDPTRLLRRSDWYAYDGDHYAAATSEGHWSTNGQTRNPGTVAGFKKHNNEILFRNGIDLLGSEAPDQIKCTSVTQRADVLAALTAKGIATIRDRPINEVVTT